MWGFLNAKDIPHDDPDLLRQRLRIGYPIKADLALGAASSRTCACSGPWPGSARRNILDRTLAWVHWVWFLEPHSALTWILARHPDRFPRSARQMSAVFDLGCATYWAVPTAPPWWASRRAHRLEVRRIMVEVGEEQWGPGRPSTNFLRGQPLGGDALAALRHLADGGDSPGREGPARAPWA